MAVLDKKLWRDIVRMKGQVIGIALIIASGTGLLVMSMSVHDALFDTANAYYERFRFGDVFADLKRAPKSIVPAIAAIDGVHSVETRIVGNSILDIPGMAEPVQGKLVSLPQHSEPVLNRVLLRSGRLPDASRTNEVVISEQFAEAHRLVPGDNFSALLNGRKRKLEIVGTALSPEFIYVMPPGALMPDDRRFGVLWVRERILEGAFDFDGAFNNVSLTLSKGADIRIVLRELDQALSIYGGTGAIARADQLSNWFVMNEIEQLKNMATILPTIFLSVAAFLTHMVLMRLITVERGEIGLFKASGYTNKQIAWHYLKLVGVIAAIGVVLGVVTGLALGKFSAQLYADVFKFPLLLFQPGLLVVVLAAAIGLGTAWLGTLNGVFKVVRLAPSEAMRPPQPQNFRRTVLPSSGLFVRLDQATRIVLRQLIRAPVRSATGALGIATGVAVSVMALQWIDSIAELVEVEYFVAQHQDVSIGLKEPQAQSALYDALHLPGVLQAQPSRSASADIYVGARRHRGGVEGIPADAQLRPIYDGATRQVKVPSGGVILGSELAAKLGVGVGDRVNVAVLTGRRPDKRLRVSDIVQTNLGMPVYMRLDELNKMLGDGPVLDAVHLNADRNEMDSLFLALKEVPALSSVSTRRAAIDMFEQTVEETIFIFIGFYIAFAMLLSFGVSYNTARIGLSENARDLATLRILGFTRTEIAYICLAETAILALIALPIGCVLGYGLSKIMALAFATELFRVPLIVTPAALGLAASVSIVATVVSLVLVRSRLDRLDLISVLKTRE